MVSSEVRVVSGQIFFQEGNSNTVWKDDRSGAGRLLWVYRNYKGLSQDKRNGIGIVELYTGRRKYSGPVHKWNSQTELALGKTGLWGCNEMGYLPASLWISCVWWQPSEEENQSSISPKVQIISLLLTQRRVKPETVFICLCSSEAWAVFMGHQGEQKYCSLQKYVST